MMFTVKLGRVIIQKSYMLFKERNVVMYIVTFFRVLLFLEAFEFYTMMPNY